MTSTLTQQETAAPTAAATANNSYDESALEEIFLAIRCGTAAAHAKEAGLPAEGAVVVFPTVILGPPSGKRQTGASGQRAFPMTGPGGAPLAYEPGSVFAPGVATVDWEVVEKRDGGGWKLTGTFAVIVGDGAEVDAASMKVHPAATTPPEVTAKLKSITPPKNVRAPVATDCQMERQIRRLVRAREDAEGVRLIAATAGWVTEQADRLHGPIATADPALDRSEFEAELLAWLLVEARRFGSPDRPTNALWSRHLAVGGQRDAGRHLFRATAARTGTTQVVQEIRLRLKQAPPEVQAGTVDAVRWWRAQALAATRLMRETPGLTRSEAAAAVAADPDPAAECDWSDQAINEALADSPQFAAVPPGDNDSDRYQGAPDNLFGGVLDEGIEAVGDVEDIIDRLVTISDGRLAPSEAALLLVLGPQSNAEIGMWAGWQQVPADLQGAVEKWRAKAALLDDPTAQQAAQRNAAAAVNSERRRIIRSLVAAAGGASGDQDDGWEMLTYRGGGLRTSEEITAARQALREAEAFKSQPCGVAALNDAAWLDRRYNGDGATQAEIGAELGCGQRAVSRALARHGITARPARVAALDDAAWLDRRYTVDGATQAEIAAEVGCGQRSVSRALARHGITARPVGRAAS